MTLKMKITLEKRLQILKVLYFAIYQVKDGKHEGLYNLITEFFKTHNIDYKKNMVGFASDGASVMFGAHHSVAAKLLADIPGLFTLKCICHSLARAVSTASSEFPQAYEQLLSDVYGYLKYSSIRQNALREKRIELKVPDRKIQKRFQIRWLALESAVTVFLQQYDAVKAYFLDESKSKNAEATRIYNLLNSTWTKFYLNFLKYVLGIVCQRNKEFQAETPKIHQLHMKMESLFKTIVKSYMDEEYVNRHEPEYIEYKTKSRENERYWLPLRELDLGPVVDADLRALPSTVPIEHIDKFRDSCRTFLMKLAQEIYKRFPFDEPSVKILRDMSFLNPQMLMRMRNLGLLANFFRLDTEEVHEEFRKLKTMFRHHAELEPEIFWKNVADVVTTDDEKEFPLIMTIVSKVQVLPHSSANCERIFSAINRNKTKSRNQIESQTLSGILHTKRLTSKKTTHGWNINCSPIVPLVNKDMYCN